MRLQHLTALTIALPLLAPTAAAAQSGDFYAQIGGGWVGGEKPEVDYIGIPIDIDPIETDDGWSAHGLAGMDLGSFRAEIELQHLRGPKRTFRVERVEINPGVAITDAQNRLTALTANAALDVFGWGGLQPFVTGGIGIGWTDDETAILNLSTVTPSATTESDESTGLVAQAGLGLEWRVTDSIAVVPAWKHVWSFVGADSEYDTLRLGVRFYF